MGGKSDGLRLLVESGERVPPYVVIGPGEIDLSLLDNCGPGPYAVRSDAADEDGTGSAQAGRYASFLRVTREDVAARVNDVRASYGVVTSGSVIVQQQVEADVSGVAFSAHPAGILDQAVVTAGPGVGAVVGGEGPSRTWVTSTLDRQRYTYATALDVAELLTPERVDEVTAAAVRIAGQRGGPVDIEWAYEGDVLWLLQARPVTTLAAGPVTTLDNSNLVESYPGLVSPLTATFVPRAYEGVFGSLALAITGDPGLVATYSDVLARMVAGSSGRLFYRMESWYAVLGLMPFAERYIDVWQTSLGVAERSYAPPPARIGRLRRVRTALGLVRELWRTPARLDDLARRVREVRTWFPADLAAASTLADLRALYERVEQDLLAYWGVTLLNDVWAFVTPALLRGIVRNDAAVNELVSGIASIESLKPVRELAALASDVPADLDRITTGEAAAAYVEGSDPYAVRLRSYMETYGDRYLEELKLESPTFRTDPLLLVEAIRRLRNSGGLGATATGPVEQAGTGTPRPHPQVLRSGSTPRAVTGRIPGVGWLSRAATRAIAGRESSRLDRARVYGMVRSIALRAGDLLVADGLLDDPRDVFWLTLDELWGDPGTGLRRSVARRRADHESYVRLPGFRRVTFAGEPFDVIVPVATTEGPRMERVGSVRGEGVSGGVATGEVLVVTDPRTVGDATGKVLVTTMTDPGWVFLMSRAAAVVAERGSLLSHTAIVARELGVPAVVGIPDATRLFTDGERVTVDGSRGEVRR